MAASKKSSKKTLSKEQLLVDHEALDILSHEAKLLRNTLEKSQAPGRRFLIGIMAGVGSAIGATIIAAFLLFWLSRFFTSFGITDFLPGIEVITNQNQPTNQAIDQGL